MVRHILLVLLTLFVVTTPGRLSAEEEPVSTLPEPLLSHEDLVIHRYQTTCNTYIATCRKTNRFVVVDPGTGITTKIQDHEKAGGKLEAIWITHEHGDHLSALGEVAAKWKIPVVSSAEGKDGIETTIAHWNMWWPDEAKRPEAPVVPDTLVKDEGEVKLGATAWKVRLAPGHSPGGVLYLLGDRIVLTGDVLFRGAVGRTDLPAGNAKTLAESLSRTLWDLPDAMVVLPGHMAETTIGREKKANWMFQDLVRGARKLEPVARPWMGIGLDPHHTSGGVRITEVVPDSPAAKAGILPDDVILKLGDREIGGAADLRPAIAPHGIGDAVKVEIRRGEQTKTLTLTFGRRPKQG